MSASGHADTVRELCELSEEAALALIDHGAEDADDRHGRICDLARALVAALEQAEREKVALLELKDAHVVSGREGGAHMTEPRTLDELAEAIDREVIDVEDSRRFNSLLAELLARAVAAERRAANAETFVQLIADRGCLFAGQPNCDCIRCHARAVLAGSQTTQEPA